MFNTLQCSTDGKEKYLSVIWDWMDKKQISLEEYDFSKKELINLCSFCLTWLKRETAKDIICAIMHIVIDAEIKIKAKK